MMDRYLHGLLKRVFRPTSDRLKLRLTHVLAPFTFLYVFETPEGFYAEIYLGKRFAGRTERVATMHGAWLKGVRLYQERDAGRLN